MANESGSRRPTVETISQLAGVSPSTVSRALNGDKRISAKTRTLIAEIARELGYFPHANARSLITRRSGLVGFVMGDINNPFYPELLERLVNRCSERGQRLMVLHVGRASLQESTIEALLQYQMDGCIISSAELTSRAAEICLRYRVPLVMINRVPRIHSCAVSCDNEGGGRLLCELLIAAGHRRIAIVAGTPNTSTSSNREAGAMAILKRHGLAPFARLAGHSTYEGGLAAAEELASRRQLPDAVYAINDIMALGVIDGLRKRGIAIPDDVSVVGFDDIRMASWPAYDLTTVAQPLDAMVDRAIDLLEERILNPESPGEQVYISGELRIRSSCRLPPNMSEFLINYGCEHPTST